MPHTSQCPTPQDCCHCTLNRLTCTSSILQYHHKLPDVDGCLLWAQMRQEVLHSDNELIGATEDTLSDAYQAAGDTASAAKHCASSLRIVQQSYGSDSLAAAHRMLQLASVLKRGGDSGFADLAGRARESLSVHHGFCVAAEFCAGQIGV